MYPYQRKRQSSFGQDNSFLESFPPNKIYISNFELSPKDNQAAAKRDKVPTWSCYWWIQKIESPTYHSQPHLAKLCFLSKLTNQTSTIVEV